MTRRIRVGLLWHSARSGNLGVGALTIGNIALATKAAARVGLLPEFMIFGTREVGALYVTDPDVGARTITGRYMTSLKGFWRDLGEIDVMLDIGAGDSFTDIYPDKRFAYMWGSKLLTILRRRTLILSPQTIGPFSRQPHSAVAAWACRHAEAVFARDPLSMAAMARLAPTARTIEVVDVAFALPFDPAPRGTSGKLRVGLNVSGLLFNGGHTGNNEFGIEVDYTALTHALLKAFTARPDVQIELISHVYSKTLSHEDDGRVADRLAAEYPGVVRVPDFAGPSEAKSYISGLDFLVGGRMHATIAAYSSGVPVVPISYSRKFEGLFGGLGYPWLVPVRGHSTEEAVAFVLDAFERRAELAADIESGKPIVEAGLERYVAELATSFAAAIR
ncbi:polysaccharide pyruvyl transferase family protein [Sphingosinicellaceae bacterium]|nr:polysaccharide pyruvyl transferase family protein [Sphingosinicellaceae bacterium]